MLMPGNIQIQLSTGVISVLENFTKLTGQHLCQVPFIENETLAQVFSNFCKIFKNTFFIEEFWVTTSKYISSKQLSVLSTKYSNCLGRSKTMSA